MVELLAKSPTERGRKSLREHTVDVMNCVRLLFGEEAMPSRLCEMWLRFFKLDDIGAFRRNTLAAAAAHDWGKANQGFQDAITRREKQVIRHEHLSGLLLTLDDVTRWFFDAQAVDRDVVVAAVLSHHLKVRNENLAEKLTDRCLVPVLWAHDDFQVLLCEISSTLGLRGDIPTVNPLWTFGIVPQAAGSFDLFPLRKRLISRLSRFDAAIADDEAHRRMLWAVRAALIAADAVASAEVRMDHSLCDWISEALDLDKLCTGERVWSDVIQRRIEDLKRAKQWDETKGNNGWSKFQEHGDSLPSRSLLLAPCGSGKTLAAWRWIASRLAERPAARVIFLYPTRATATEGFRDYVSWAPETDAALVHGTAEYDLQGMFENPPEGAGEDPRRQKRFEVDERLFALGLWHRRLFAATVDQFFAFLQYSYGSMCLLPLLADSVVVVDEVHSFDRGMFPALKQFLNTFDVPVLCMTASLQEVRWTPKTGQVLKI